MKYFLIFLSLCFLIACNKNSKESPSLANSAEYYYEKEQIEPPRTAEPPPPSVEEDDEQESSNNNDISPQLVKKIIRDGNIKMQVEDVKRSKLFLDTIIAGLGGYYENESYTANDYRANYNLRIRIPFANFDSFLFGLERGGGTIVSRDIKARDVTADYYDTVTRLKNNEAYLKRYNELLSKAKSIKDMLEIQERMRTIEEEMDARKGRIRWMDDQVNYSSLNLNLIQKLEYTPRAKVGFGQKIANAFKAGFEGLLDFLLMMVHLWPFLLFLGLAWFFMRHSNFSFRRKKK